MKFPVRYKYLAFALVTCLLFSLASSNIVTRAAPATQGESYQGELPRLVLYADPTKVGSERQSLLPENYLSTAAQTAMIHVNYVGTWNPAARNAFEYATQVWQTLVGSTVTIEVRAEWVAMGATTLGGAWAEGVRRDFQGAPLEKNWYPDALANKLAGKDLDPESHDINAQFNSSFPDWYFGTDGKPGVGKYDFVSVVMHELCHGLGFFESFGMSGSSGYWGLGNPTYPIVFDNFVVNGSGKFLIEDYPNSSTALGSQLTSDNIFFSGTAAMTANSNANVALYAPKVWSQGSSLSHLGEVFNGTPNAMMTFSLPPGEVDHDPGPVTMGILKDIGWSLAPAQKPLNHKSYLPAMLRSYSRAPLGINGQISLNGVKTKAIPVELRRYDPISNGSWTTILTATTDISGRFSFTSAPSLGSGQKYSVLYRNSSLVAGRLWVWSTKDVTSYQAGSNLEIGNFDISDVPLVSPNNAVTVTLPYTFQWQTRPATPKDSYEFDLYDPIDGNPYWWTNPSLGYVHRYTLSALPVDPVTRIPFVTGTRYSWEVWVYGPDGGHGVSLGARSITFSSPGSSPARSTPENGTGLSRDLLPDPWYFDRRHSNP